MSDPNRLRPDGSASSAGPPRGSVTQKSDSQSAASGSLYSAARRPASIRRVRIGSAAQTGTSNTSAYASAPQVSVASTSAAGKASLQSKADSAHHLSPESLPSHSSAAELKLRKMASNSTLRGEAAAGDAGGATRSRPTSVYESARPAKAARTAEAHADAPTSDAAPGRSVSDSQAAAAEGGASAGGARPRPQGAAARRTANRRTWFGFGSVVLEESGPAADAIADEMSGAGASAEDARADAQSRSEMDTSGSEPPAHADAVALSSEQGQAPVSTASRLWLLWLGQGADPGARRIEEAAGAQEPEAMDISEDMAVDEAQLGGAGDLQAHEHAIQEVDSAALEAAGDLAAAAAQRAGRIASYGSYGSYISSWIPYIGARAPAQAPAGESPDGTDKPQAAAADPDAQPDAQAPPLRTPAEQVQDAALARMQEDERREQESKAEAVKKQVGNALSTAAAVAGTATGSKDGRDSKAALNDQTKSSWVSFFSSKTANPARSGTAPAGAIEAPEVMDLDEPTEPSTDKAAPTAKQGDARTKPEAVTASKAANGAADPSAPSAEPAKTAADGAAPKAPASAGGVTLRTIASLAKLRTGAAANAEAKRDASAQAPQADAPVLAAPKAEPEPPASNPATPLTGAKAAKAVVGYVPYTKKSNGQRPPAPNLVMPTFEDTFDRPPRSHAPRVGVLERTLSAVNSYLFSKQPDAARMKRPSTGGRKMSKEEEAASRLPKAWHAMGDKERASTKGCGKVAKICVIGVHGWFTQGLLRTVMGEPSGTSEKFASMMAAAVRQHFKDADHELNPEAVTVIPLQGEGKVADRVDKLFANLLANKSWVEDVRSADAIFVAAHSQGAVVAAHLLARLIEQKHVSTARARVCLLAMCGIHNGPFAHLQSSLTGSYLHYFETAAARELFEFQSSTSAVSKQFASALQICLSAGVKVVYVGSVDDQVVPLYSALHTTVSHPSILRALYVDGQAFPRTDFLINLLTFCVAVRNAGLIDHNLLTLLSSSVAGSLYGGAGHSLIYNEPATYALAARYLFEVTSPLSEPTVRSPDEKLPPVEIEPFEAQHWNPYQLPWALRGLLEDARVRDLFGDHIIKLIDDYADWKPVTKTLKDVQLRLQPMTGIKKPDLPAHSSTSSHTQKTPPPRL